LKEPQLEELVSEMKDKIEVLERRNGELLEEIRRVDGGEALRRERALPTAEGA